jgi:hypothetical protein
MKTELRNGVVRAEYDAIDSVFIKEVMTGLYPRSAYCERPTRYLVKFAGESRKRRVYVTPIGNVSVMYVKTSNGLVYCETALESALHRI